MEGEPPAAGWVKGEPPAAGWVRILLAHGARDTQCPVEESRSLARVLESARKPAQYVEFDGGHVVPAEAVRALALFATAP